eukprot:jgi/Hompol1/5659/HPOL_001770-RA
MAFNDRQYRQQGQYQQQQQQQQQQQSHPYNYSQGQSQRQADYRRAESVYSPNDPFAEPALFSNSGDDYAAHQHQQQAGIHPAHLSSNEEPVAYRAPPSHTYMRPAMVAEAVSLPRDAVGSDLYGDRSRGGAQSSSGGMTKRSEANSAQRYDDQYDSFGGVKPSGKNFMDMSGNDDEFDSIDRPKKKAASGRYCLCFRSKRGLIIFASVLAFVLVVLAVIGYFFFPRNPDMKVNWIEAVKNSITPVSLADDGVNLMVSMQLTLYVSVVNINKYALRTNRIDLNAAVQPNVTQLSGIVLAPGKSNPLQPAPGFEASIGTSNISVPMTFPSSLNTSFTMDFMLKYTTTPDPLSDVGFGEVLQSCGLLGPTRRPMLIHYRATATIDFLAKFGFVPTFDNFISINCPGDIIRALESFNLSAYGIGVNSGGGGTPSTTVSVPLPATATQTRPVTRVPVTSTTRTAVGRFAVATTAIHH